MRGRASLELVMIPAQGSSSTSVSTVGHVLTGLPLFCPVCHQLFEKILRGAVLRVNGQLWLFCEGALLRLARPTCPACGNRDLYAATIL